MTFQHAFRARVAASAIAARPPIPAPSTLMARLFIPLMLLGFTPSMAQAQFGKLKDIGSRAAKEAAARKVIEAAGGDASAAGGVGNANGAGSSASASYDITPERLDAVLAVLSPMVETARSREASKQLVEAFTAKRTAFEECAATAAKRAMSVSPEGVQRSGEVTARMTPMIERYSVISQDPSRKREMLMLQDSMTVLSVQSQMALVGATCGAPVYRTLAIVDAELAADQFSGTAHTSVPLEKQAGMTKTQFGRIRERIALWALIQEGHAKPGEGRFTDAELQTLQPKASELRTLAPFFRDGSLSWTHWGDLKGW